MNKNYLILLIVILAIIVYNCWNTKEGMNTVQGNVYLKGDKIKDIYNLTLNKIKEIPTIEEEVVKYLKLVKDEEVDDEVDDEVEEEVGEEETIPEEILDPMWEEKRMPIGEIIKLLSDKLKQCGVDKLNINLKDIIGLNNRKRFIQLLPIFRDDIKKRINYDQIKCFITRYEPDNYISLAKVQKVIPRYLPHRNMVIINNFLYQFTAYGVLKYKIPVHNNVDTTDTVVTASMEATLINDINKFNDSSRIIIPLKGKLYQIKRGKFYNLRTGEKVDIIGMIKRLYKKRLEILKRKKLQSEKKILLQEEEEEEDEVYHKYYDEYIEYKNKYIKLKEKIASESDDIEEETSDLRNKAISSYDEEDEEEMKLDNVKNKLILKKIKKEKLPSAFFNKTLYVINYSKDMYIIKPRKILPNKNLGAVVNKMIKKNDIIIRGVVPHFYNGIDGKFHIEYLFLCNSNFYFFFKDGKVSQLKDFKKDFGFFFTKKLKYELSCQEHKTILNQLVQSNNLSISRKNRILNSLRCYNDKHKSKK